MPDFEVIYYNKKNGDSPAKDFLDSLDEKMAAKMLRAINRLEEAGASLREPYSKPLGDGIFELRTQFSTDIARVLYFFIINNRAVLTHGFIKKTQKTPPQEIEKAKRYRKDYLQRSE
ncbi:MAG: type II toxin-antitoxin system RelE/ParE family toxin [Synergistaceae bacterium]|nr:type II toxin-antitoxin system RelE/ParE family toxin [Synergistaceae bacterium]